MSTPNQIVDQLAELLRRYREAQGVTIAALAHDVGVSPRLVSEFERGKRPHVSLETAMRLLQQVGAPLFALGDAVADEHTARAERAARRRQTWQGTFSTLATQATPAPPTQAAQRLLAVAQASALAGGLRKAYQYQTQVTPKRAPRPTR
ncbi:MAG TPA: helix-turn-helix transcriptional regulator [Gemmatimonas sp.]|uniref:helix-turn-helix domain-containing protein n=1 Tax=Gemmatimonas sp. TaxID=1962908 RepID=UPI002ED87749